MQPQIISHDDFDFSKLNNQKIDKPSSYKKVAFLTIAMSVVFSSGMYFSNSLLNSPSKEVTQSLNIQARNITNNDFTEISHYYEHVMSMYDKKLDFLLTTSNNYDSQLKPLDFVLGSREKGLIDNAVLNHQENIQEILTQLNTLKNKTLENKPLNYKEAQFLLNCAAEAKQHTPYHNIDVEEQFNHLIKLDIPGLQKYLIKNNIGGQLKVIDAQIEESFLTLPIDSNTNPKPKL